MRYWLYLAGKFVVATLAVYGLNYAVTHSFSVPKPTRFGADPSLFLHDMTFTFAVFGVGLAAAGIFSLVVWDQRRRCRTCLRRLIMPVRTGSWSNMLTIGRPTVEWICPYGHGTLRIDELQITGKDTPDWLRHDDNIWKELESYYEAPK
jgi:hypothetical protein